MREIKFRAWDKKRKEWVHKQACSILGETILLCGWMQRPNGHHVRLEELNDIEVLQYTGLKDKNDIEIYEGDILKTGPCIWDNAGQSAIMQVMFINDHQENGFIGKILNHENLSGMYIPPYSRLDSSYEVIGNIYENEELLT